MQINGQALKSLREFAGQSQLGLSKATDPTVSQGRISEIESAESPVNVRPSTAQALARALGVPLSALIVPVDEPDEAVA